MCGSINYAYTCRLFHYNSFKARNFQNMMKKLHGMYTENICEGGRLYNEKVY